MRLFKRKPETREAAEQRIVQVRRMREHAPMSEATARKLLARNLVQTGGFGR